MIRIEVKIMVGYGKDDSSDGDGIINMDTKSANCYVPGAKFAKLQ